MINTQISLIMNKEDVLQFVAKLTNVLVGMDDEQHVWIQSFGSHVGAWRVSDPYVAGM